MQIFWSWFLEVFLILAITVRSRKFKTVGDKTQRLRKSIHVAGETLYQFESEPYGLSVTDVEEVVQARLETLRTALIKCGINTNVVREEI